MKYYESPVSVEPSRAREEAGPQEWTVGWVFLEMDYSLKHEETRRILWLMTVWIDGVGAHSKGLAPARTQGARENGFANLFTFIPSYPADLRFSYFIGHLGLIKIRFKNYKALEFWKGVGLGYCVCEMITSPTSCISLLSKMDLGRKSIK